MLYQLWTLVLTLKLRLEILFPLQALSQIPAGWTHTAEWNFGEGTVEAGSVSEENESPDSTGTVSGSFSYFDAGEYTVTLNVTDYDGGIGQDQAIVIVRPIEPKLISIQIL